MQAIHGEETLENDLLEEYARRIDSDGSGQLSLHEFTSYLGTCYLLEPAEGTNPLFVQMVPPDNTAPCQGGHLSTHILHMY